MCGSDLIKYGIAVGALIHNDSPLKDETLLLGMLLLQQERALKELQLSPNKVGKLWREVVEAAQSTFYQLVWKPQCKETQEWEQIQGRNPQQLRRLMQRSQVGRVVRIA